jgi:hypothetical protein
MYNAIIEPAEHIPSNELEGYIQFGYVPKKVVTTTTKRKRSKGGKRSITRQRRSGLFHR